MLPTKEITSIIDRKEALQNGFLIDISDLAEGLEIPVPIGITRTLFQKHVCTGEAEAKLDKYDPRTSIDTIFQMFCYAIDSVPFEWNHFVFGCGGDRETNPNHFEYQITLQKDGQDGLCLTVSLPGEVAF